MDSQSAFGKTALGVARLCRAKNVRAVAIVGALEGDDSAFYREGLAACFSVLRRPQTLEEAIADCETALAAQAENVVRLFLAGH
jgi:glycerate kinase